ncbi:TetR/AcrR family transcriptional regulator [Amycolatopsis sp. EV170708-02-1]|uniref:TetR/AcrR family transcriptional regulator n=1 Tax=Amycolatopsis sp. EV170708-02-1 TaxID=2919322 RepID=UPI001F0C16EA|nr:TetR/AcrR family transcriptional regulator [Amycolatopsis sp. EV170708-02-1]UMP07045.1 TetR/AcrR family transcriptional regulator [Amycolatopsis sp. EV170708-02-1]
MSSTGRRPRADALRNRDRLLAEADTVFREQGTGAPLESVARRAGVAIGTLYGHFPTRRALVGAVLRDRNEALFAAGNALCDQPPEAALRHWAALVVEHAATYRGLAGMLADGVDDDASELHASCERMSDIGERLVDRAVAAQVVRQGVTGADLFALMNAGAWTREHSSDEQAARLVSYTIDGMLATGSR